MPVYLPKAGSLGGLVLSAFVGALLSSSLVVFIAEQLAARRTERVIQEVRAEYERERAITEWKALALAELVGPAVMQLDRTRRAFNCYNANNRFLEAEVLYKGNLAVRDLLLTHGHLISENLRDVSGRLIEHYDRWLEEYDRVRGTRPIASSEPFVFVGPQGYPFPRDADSLFNHEYRRLWTELYGPIPSR